jgi:DNA-binding winged helix-turn-helix (wHTH) protein
VSLRFADCVLDPAARQLVRGGRPVPLSPKAFDLLALLVEARPRAVSKAEIRDRLWPRTFVNETNLTGLVTEIRAALGDSRRAARCLRTVHGYGYAFAAPVSELPAAPSAPATDFSCRLIWGNREIVLIEGDNVLGRSHAAQIWIDSHTVSRRHASVRVDRGDARLRDLGSKNGTCLNGERLTGEAPLADGDEIRVGAARMVFRRHDPAGSTATGGDA